MLKQVEPEFYSDAPVTNVFAKVKCNRMTELHSNSERFNLSIKMPKQKLK